MPSDRESVSDRLVHQGRSLKGDGRLVNLPIEQGSTMLFDSLAAFEKARADRYAHGTLYYGRYGTTSTIELERMIADLEGGHATIAVSAGLTAVSMALTGILAAGDHALVADNVYGPTRGFCDTILARYGVTVEYFDPMLGEGIADLMRDETRAVMIEAPGSGTFEVCDIPAIAAVARAHGALSIIDGTWATPIFCQPFTLGVDVVVHSGSKYITGHSDCMIGFIVCGGEAVYDRIRRTTLAFGEKPGSQDVFLALRGLRTLDMRMRAAEANAMAVAGWLQDQPQVSRMLHPAFPDCPGHAHWKRNFSGASGLFSVLVKPCAKQQVHLFVDGLRHFGVGVSWGGFESLVLPVEPHRTAAPWTAQGQVIRFAVGNEATATLIEDLAQALAHLN
ncbi:MAG: cystathionine beta-lyase [Pseudomonadota bacterium]